MIQTKVTRQTQTTPYSQVGRLPEKQPRVRTVQTRNSSAVEALFEILAEKREMDAKLTQIVAKN